MSACSAETECNTPTVTSCSWPGIVHCPGQKHVIVVVEDSSSPGWPGPPFMHPSSIAGGMLVLCCLLKDVLCLWQPSLCSYTGGDALRPHPAPDCSDTAW